MTKTVSRRLAFGAMVVVFLALALANPFGVRFLQTLSAWADSIAGHQTASTQFGVSGGNINDISTIYCCSGTLGSLVTDGTKKYILSNSHVLARSGAGSVGDDISQPGLIDNGCRVPPVVADLTAWAALGSNVDAAIAELRTGAMDATGSILGIGTISNIVRAPSVGLNVLKSGRTTGVTNGAIGSINTNVSVQYQQRCGIGKKFVVSYTNQVVINSSTFSAGGDSGSLIVTNDSSKNPVALLYAGSSSTTIGNPVGEVLTKLSTSSRSLSFVGSAVAPVLSGTVQGGTTQTQGSPQSIRQAHAAKEKNADALMARPGVIGVGVGTTEDGSKPAVIIYVDVNAGGRANIPSELDGTPARVVLTDAFISR